MGTARGTLSGTSRAGIAAALQTRTPNTQSPFEAYRKLASSATVPGDLSALFRNGELGAWYDVSDMSTLFQDAAGTIPVTGLSQPVGLMLDKRSPTPQVVENGVELIANGDFSNGSTNWVLGPSWSVSGGEAIKSGVDTDQIYQDIAALTVGATYLLTYTNTAVGGGMSVLARVGAVGAVAWNLAIPTGTGSLLLTAAAAATRLSFFFGGSTATGTLDNVSLREVIVNRGNYVIASAAAARPTLEARHNRLIETELFNGAAWSPSNVTVAQDILDVAAPNGTFTAATLTAGATNATMTQAYTNPVTNTYTFSVWMRRRTGTGTVGIQAGTGSYTTVTLTNDWQRFSVTSSVTTTGVRSAGIQIGTSGDEVDVWGAQLELYGAVSEYQRVTSATDYEDIGLPRYLQFDGVDDQLASVNIVFPVGTPSLANGLTLAAAFQTTGVPGGGNTAYFRVAAGPTVLWQLNNRADQAIGGQSLSVQCRVDANNTAGFATPAGLPSNFTGSINRNVRRPCFLLATVNHEGLTGLRVLSFADGGVVAPFAETNRSVQSVPFSASMPIIVAGGLVQNQFYGGLAINRALSLRESLQVAAYIAPRAGCVPNFQ
jgi:hypothetical protein